MSKEDMMNKISFALKDPILQMGFEVICSKLSRLEKENAELKLRGEMTVTELHKELSLLIEQGHGDTRVIANINFKSPWELKKCGE